MEVTGERLIKASRQKTWDALNDPDVLKGCIAGCDALEKVSDNEYAVSMLAKVGPVSARFRGKLMLEDVAPMDSYRIRFEGQGGAAGFGKGTADVALADEGEATRLTYKSNAQVGGKLAQVGSRLIDSAARKMADDFFAKFDQIVAPAPQAVPAAAEAAAAAQGAAAPGAAARTPEQDARRALAFSIAALVVSVIALAVALLD